MRRISEKELSQSIDWLNQRMGLSEDGEHFVLNCAYGGFKLELRTKNYCTRDIQPYRGSKRECYQYVHAMLTALDEWERVKKL